MLSLESHAEETCPKENKCRRFGHGCAVVVPNQPQIEGRVLGEDRIIEQVHQIEEIYGLGQTDILGRILKSSVRVAEREILADPSGPLGIGISFLQ